MKKTFSLHHVLYISLVSLIVFLLWKDGKANAVTNSYSKANWKPTPATHELAVDFLSRFAEKVSSYDSSKMDPAVAREMIANYITSDPAAATQLRSVWLNEEIIAYIQQTSHSLNGLRIYLAKYKAGVGGIAANDPRVGKLTFIVAPTWVTNGLGDGEGDYFNYGEICPPNKCGIQ